ncbi:hypothetical protein M8J77_006392 [Diaphorina citri]|nr:hypothetical protein M8J77_006392 [Diaphorina citri]
METGQGRRATWERRGKEGTRAWTTQHGDWARPQSYMGEERKRRHEGLDYSAWRLGLGRRATWEKARGPGLLSMETGTRP